MNAKDFIFDHLNRLVNLIPELTIKYKYEKSYNTHVVEVTPSSHFNNNEEYLEYESSMEELFSNFFPKEELVFITEGALNEIDAEDYIFKANNLNWTGNCLTENWGVIEYGNNIHSGSYNENFAIAA